MAKHLDLTRWPAGRPAARGSAFFWRDRLSEAALALQAQADARAASSKAVREAEARGINRSTIYGLSRKSDALLNARGGARRPSPAGGASA